MAWDYRKLFGRRDFAVEYYNTFAKVAESFGTEEFDHESYRWLTKNGIKMQAELGSLGVISYKPAFSNYYIQNYQPVLNTIPELRTGNAHRSDLMTLDDMLVRHIGRLDNRLEQSLSELKNPIFWLRDGIGFIVALPISMLGWFGIVGNSFVRSVKGSFLFKLLSFLIALVGLIASLITIFLGWSEFLSLLDNLI